MNDNGRFPEEIAPNEATLDAPLVNTLTEDPSSQGSGPRMHFVEGSGPGMSCETRALLRSRVRAAALLMFAAMNDPPTTYHGSPLPARN